jgi:small subunit ribosomal protein S9
MTESKITVTTPAMEAATPVVPGKEYTWGTGRRKTSVARVRMRPGTGVMLVNGKPSDVFFPIDQHQVDIQGPLKATGLVGRYDVFANIRGGGITGQAGALRLGLARAIRRCEPDKEEALREGGFLTRDSRMVERKKYGQAKARKRFQFSKR